MRMNEVPASSGYGEPVAKFFRLADQVQIVNAVTTDERFIAGGARGQERRAAGPYLLVVTAQGQTLRVPLAPFRTASNKLGRRYVRLDEGDRVVMATVLKDEDEHLPGVGVGARHPFPGRGNQHPVGGRQGRDGHQAGEGRHLPGRRPDRPAASTRWCWRRRAARRWSFGRASTRRLPRRQGVRGGQADHVSPGRAAADRAGGLGHRRAKEKKRGRTSDQRTNVQSTKKGSSDLADSITDAGPDSAESAECTIP